MLKEFRRDSLAFAMRTASILADFCFGFAPWWEPPITGFIGVGIVEVLRQKIGDRAEALRRLTYEALRSKDFKRPFNHGGGSAQIASRIDPNTFAADLAPVPALQTRTPTLVTAMHLSSTKMMFVAPRLSGSRMTERSFCVRTFTTL
jgi:hypothetical protein